MFGKVVAILFALPAAAFGAPPDLPAPDFGPSPTAAEVDLIDFNEVHHGIVQVAFWTRMPNGELESRGWCYQSQATLKQIGKGYYEVTVQGRLPTVKSRGLVYSYTNSDFEAKCRSKTPIKWTYVETGAPTPARAEEP